MRRVKPALWEAKGVEVVLVNDGTQAPNQKNALPKIGAQVSTWSANALTSDYGWTQWIFVLLDFQFQEGVSLV